jgi:o-succinylbenzoate synthase
VPEPLTSGDGPPVESIELIRVRLPLLEPHVSGHGVERDRESVLVCAVLESGAIGWGECPTLTRPSYSPEYTDEAWRVLGDHLVPAHLEGRTHPMVGHPMARSALEAALIDARLRSQGVSLVDALGGTARPIATTAVVGIGDSIDDTLRRARRRVDEGHRHLKLKIVPGNDVEPLQAVAEAFPSVGLAADANGSYPRSAAVPSALASLGLSYLEQPLPADDLLGAAEVADRLGIVVALDESITGVGVLATAIAVGAVGAINVKPARVGGLVESAALLAAAQRHGIAAFVGGMFETGIGRAASLALASHPGCNLPTDLGPSSRYFEQDLTSPMELVTGGCLLPPAGPGIGVVPLGDALERFALERRMVAR